jgi:hypothetical protein
MNGFAGFSKSEWRLVMRTQERLSCMIPALVVLSGVVMDAKIPTSQATWLLSMGKTQEDRRGSDTQLSALTDKLFENL